MLLKRVKGVQASTLAASSALRVHRIGWYPENFRICDNLKQGFNLPSMCLFLLLILGLNQNYWKLLRFIEEYQLLSKATRFTWGQSGGPHQSQMGPKGSTLWQGALPQWGGRPPYFSASHWFQTTGNCQFLSSLEEERANHEQGGPCQPLLS